MKANITKVVRLDDVFLRYFIFFFSHCFQISILICILHN